MHKFKLFKKINLKKNTNAIKKRQGKRAKKEIAPCILEEDEKGNFVIGLCKT